MTMKRILIILCFAFPSFIIAQNDSIINYTDINGMKQGFWVKKDIDGQKIYEGYFKNDIPYGTFKRYHTNGVLKAIMVFDTVDQKKIQVIYYDDAGEKSATGYFNGRMRDSIWQFFGADMKLVEEEHYVSGKRNGMSKKFYPSGKEVEEICFKDGKMNGTWLRYYENGNLRMKTQEVMDKRIGDFYSYFADGKVEIQGNYKNDVKEGLWKIFDNKGKVLKEMKFVNDTLENEEAIDEKYTKEINDAEKNQGKYYDPDKDRKATEQMGGGGE